MGANEAKNRERVKKLKRLLFAEQSMMIVTEACDFVINGRLSQNQRTVYTASVVTLYASPFTEANGLGQLEAKFSTFADQDLADIHATTIACRHQIYAHKDMTAMGISNLGFIVPVHRAFVNIDSRENYSTETTDVKMENSDFEKVRRLAKFQGSRISEKASQILRKLAIHSNVTSGRHEIGVNFP